MNPILEVVSPIILLSILIYIIAQLIAKILNKPDIAAFINMELLNIIIFIIILIVILYVTDNVVYLSVSILNPEAKSEVCDKNNILPSRCHITIAGYFLESILREITDYYIQLNSIGMANSFMKYLYGVKAIQGDKSIKVNFNPFVYLVDGYLEPLIRQAQTLLQFVLAQFILLWFITSPQFFIGFLMFGIILRLFAPTKSAGGLIIALVIGLYYIFPMAYVLLDVHYRNAYDNIYGFNKINTFRFTEHLFSVFGLPKELDETLNKISGFIDIYKNPPDDIPPEEIEKRLGGVAGVLSNIASVASLLIKATILIAPLFALPTIQAIPFATLGYGLLVDLVPSIKNNIINVPLILINIYTEFLLIFAVLIYISLISTVAFVKTLSPILGGDVEIAGITRFI